MLTLDATTASLEVVLAGAITTNQLPIVSSWADKTTTTFTPGKATTQTNSTSTVTIVAAPAASTQREVHSINIYNADTVAATITVRENDNGTLRTLVKITLNVGDTLTFTHDRAWQVIDTNGAIKIPGGTVTSVAFTAAPSSVFDVSGSPITTSGTIALSMDNQSANQVLAGPASGSATTPAFRALVVADGLFYAADGRLTLASATPVMASDVTGSTSIFYALYTGDKIALYDGTSWTNTTFTELTNTTTDSTKNPAAVANNSNYDLFVWNDAGTLRLGRGPAWTSDTARGTGAGTTELERVNGVFVNKVAITNGPAAQRGRYVGTVRSNGTATIDWISTPAAASGGALCKLHVWNMNNRRLLSALCRDSDNTWTYNSLTIRAANNSNNNRISAIFGLNEDISFAAYYEIMSGGASGDAGVGIGLDSTTVCSEIMPYFSIGTFIGAAPAIYRGLAGLGFHFFQALEFQSTTTASAATFVGDANVPTKIQAGLTLIGMF